MLLVRKLIMVRPQTHLQGTVLWFNDVSGTGCLRCDRDGSLVKVSNKAIKGEGYRVLDEGERVSFTVERRREGLCAGEVRRG